MTYVKGKKKKLLAIRQTSSTILTYKLSDRYVQARYRSEQIGNYNRSKGINNLANKVKNIIVNYIIVKINP